MDIFKHHEISEISKLLVSVKCTSQKKVKINKNIIFDPFVYCAAVDDISVIIMCIGLHILVAFYDTHRDTDDIFSHCWQTNSIISINN